jgi:hypothetical protein
MAQAERSGPAAPPTSFLAVDSADGHARRVSTVILPGIVSIRAFALRVSAGLLGAAACASSPQEESTAIAEPDPRPLVEPVEETPPSPVPVDEAEREPRDARAATASEPSANPEPVAAVITGIPECDQYLALYERCEDYLRPEIMAGDRRFYRVEKASLEHFAGTPEAANLPVSCGSMLDALRVDCPEQHRRPPAPRP